MTDGLFAKYDLDVDILEPAPGADNVRRVADGGADFCLTSVNYYLIAQAETRPLAARFAAIVTQRSPMAALVAESSSLTRPTDLPGRRLGGPADSHLVVEYMAALNHLGLGPPVLVRMPYEQSPAALGRGEIDTIADFVDLIPRTRRQAGVPLRAIPFGIEVYASGLVAADRLPIELVARVRLAIVAALERQRQHRERGLETLLRRYPQSDASDALEGWRLLEPNIFAGPPPGSMTADRWRATIEYAASALRLSAPPAESVYRPELASAAQAIR